MVVLLEVLDQIAQVMEIRSRRQEALERVLNSRLESRSLRVLAEKHPYGVGQIIHSDYIEVEVRDVTIPGTLSYPPRR